MTFLTVDEIKTVSDVICIHKIWRKYAGLEVCWRTCALDAYVLIWHKYAALQRLCCILAPVTTILSPFGGFLFFHLTHLDQPGKHRVLL